VRILIFGPARDVRGFALAGVVTQTCDARASAAAALASACQAGSGFGLVLVAATFGPEAAFLRARRGFEPPPAVLVLPP
jgi:hypothetical protein